jgi:hypothetical protein
MNKLLISAILLLVAFQVVAQTTGRFVIISSQNGIGIFADPNTSLRGPNQFGDDAGLNSGVLFQSKSLAAPIGSDAIGIETYFEQPSGGFNGVNGPKTNYTNLHAVTVSRTPGQHTGLSSVISNFSNGDAIAFGGYAQSWGRNNAGGDEGTEGLSVGAYQGNTVMTATVTGIAGNVVSYNKQANENTRGEGRPLIITTPAKVYTAGNIIAISGGPPVVVGSVTQDFTTLGIGPVSNLFFSLDSLAANGLKLVIPIRSITDATHLVLDYVSEGVDVSLPTATLPSTYKIFRGGNVTALSQPGSITVSPASDFAIGDTIEQPLGYTYTLVGGHFTLESYLPQAGNAGSTGVQVMNNGPQPIRNGIVLGGQFRYGIEFNGPATYSLLIDNDVDTIVRAQSSTPGVTTNFLGINDKTGHETKFSYDRPFDVWRLGKPLVAPAFQTPVGAGVDCNGAPTSNFRVSKGIVVSC